jgi:hypothetical protein
MNNKEIKQAEKELLEIESKSRPEQAMPLKCVLEKYGIHGSDMSGLTGDKWIRESFKSAYIWLQTQTMINACITAKWSCLWAAIAAGAALLAVIISLVGTLASWISVLIMFMKGR